MTDHITNARKIAYMHFIMGEVVEALLHTCQETLREQGHIAFDDGMAHTLRMLIHADKKRVATLSDVESC